MTTIQTSKIKVLEDNNRANGEDGIIYSVEKVGILCPLLVYQDTDESYVLVAGHRRLESARFYGIEEVPVSIISKEKASEAGVLENIDRKALHPLDESEEIEKLQNKGWRNEEIASVLNISMSQLIRRAKLKNLIEPIKEKLKKGEIKLSVAEELSILPKEAQEELKEQIYAQTEPSFIRESYFAMQDMPLKDVTDEILKMDPPCLNCEKNVAGIEQSLFPECNGACSNIECYCQKLHKLQEQHGATKCFDSYAGRISKAQQEAINKQGFCFGTKESVYCYSVSNEQEGSYTVPCISVFGEIKYTREETEVEAEDSFNVWSNKDLDKLSGDYDELYEETMLLMKDYILETADSYIKKNYRNKKLSDCQDLLTLAKDYLESGKNNVAHLLYLNLWGEKRSYSEFIASLDNWQLMGIAIISAYCFKMEPESQEKPQINISPSTIGGILETEEKTVLAPYFDGIEDVLKLKTSKVRKKIQQKISELQGIVDEYARICEENGVEA